MLYGRRDNVFLRNPPIASVRLDAKLVKRFPQPVRPLRFSSVRRRSAAPCAPFARPVRRFGTPSRRLRSPKRPRRCFAQGKSDHGVAVELSGRSPISECSVKRAANQEAKPLPRLVRPREPLATPLPWCGREKSLAPCRRRP